MEVTEELLVLSVHTTDMGLWGPGDFSVTSVANGLRVGLEHAPKLPMHVDREDPAAVS